MNNHRINNRLTVAIASLLMASMGGVAFAQTTQQQPQQQPMQQQTPQEMQQRTPPSQPPGQMDQNGSQMNQMNNGSSSKDRMMAQKVKRELTSHGVTATNVHVKVDNGTATLSGTVDTHADIAKAKKDAMRVKGIKHVDTSNLQARATAQTGHGQP